MAQNLNFKSKLSQMLGLPADGSEPFFCFASVEGILPLVTKNCSFCHLLRRHALRARTI